MSQKAYSATGAAALFFAFVMTMSLVITGVPIIRSMPAAIV